MEKKPIVLDVDTGVDDAMAIMLAAASDRLDILAVTTVYGNSDVGTTTENTLKICELLGLDVPVARGAAHRMLRDYDKPSRLPGLDVHGADGLGNMGGRLPKPKMKPESMAAAELIAKVVRGSDRPVSIVATAPLTNVAAFLLAYPDLRRRIDCVALMGGAVFGGNVMPTVEANVFHDPDALQAVILSGVKTVMFGLDATMMCSINDEETGRLARTGRVGEFMAEMLAPYSRIYKDLAKIDGAVLHDSLPVAWLIDESTVRLEKHYVEVDLDGMFTCGCTVTDTNDTLGREPNVSAAVWADRERIVDMHIAAAKKFG